MGLSHFIQNGHQINSIQISFRVRSNNASRISGTNITSTSYRNGMSSERTVTCSRRKQVAGNVCSRTKEEGDKRICRPAPTAKGKDVRSWETCTSIVD